MSMGWDRLGTRAARALQATRVPRWPGAARRVPLGGLLSGLLLVGMGTLTIVLAITGPDMPTPGWRVTLTAQLQHTATVVGRQLRWLPGWAVAVLLLAALAGIACLVRRRTGHASPPPGPAADTTPPVETAQPAMPPAVVANGCCTDLGGMPPAK